MIWLWHTDLQENVGIAMVPSQEEKSHTTGAQEIPKSVNRWNLCLPTVSRLDRNAAGLRMQQSFTLLCPLSLSCWRKAFPESHNSRMEPTLPSLPLPLDTDGLESAREEALDFISFVARNYPPDATQQHEFYGCIYGIL